MTTKKKSKKKIIVFTILGLVLILILAFVCRMMYGFGLFDRKLTYDYEKAQFAKRKVSTAQYLPDPEKLASQEKNAAAAHTMKTNAASLSEDGEKEEKTNVARIGLEQFRKYIDSWGKLEGTGAGKYLGYNIYEIKDELYSILDSAPSFGKWFRMPDVNKYPDGKAPYYAGWAYNIQYDEEKDSLSMTRVCVGTRFDYFDFEKKKIVEYYNKSGTESITQFEVMRTNYYYDEEDRETVECFVYTVACDHVKQFSPGSGKTMQYQSKEKYYYPVCVQYLKNVKDTSLTRYIIEYCEGNSIDRLKKEDNWVFGEHEHYSSSYDITHRDSIGTCRDYLQLDYGGEENVRMLKVDQVDPTYFVGYDATNILYYAATEDGVGYATKCYDRCVEPTMPTLENFETIDEAGIIGDVFGYMSLPGEKYRSGIVSGETITRSKDRNYGETAGIGFLLNRSLALLGERTGVSEKICGAFVETADEKLLSEGDLAYEKTLDAYLDTIAKNIADNFCLRREWAKIYKDSDQATWLKKEGSDGSATTEKIKVEEAVVNVSISNNTTYYTASGKVKSSILLQDGKNYSLGLVLKSERGDWYLMDGNASGVQFSHGKELVLSGAGEAKFADLDLKISGTYTLGYALVKEGKTICSEFIPANVEAYEKVEIPEKEENGIVKTYEVTCEDGVLKINFVSKDIEAPTISGVANGSVRTVEKGTPIAYAFYGMNIDDNDEIVCVEFYHGVTKYKNWGDAIVAGLNTLVVRDAAGNETKVTITIIIV